MFQDLINPNTVAQRLLFLFFFGRGPPKNSTNQKRDAFFSLEIDWASEFSKRVQPLVTPKDSQAPAFTKTSHPRSSAETPALAAWAVPRAWSLDSPAPQETEWRVSADGKDHIAGVLGFCLLLDGSLSVLQIAGV